MKKSVYIALTAMFCLFSTDSATPATAAAQESAATKLAAISHPDKALCTVCTAKGSAHGKEAVAAKSEYKGSWYYFCAVECQKTFDADPASWVTLPLPRPAPDISVRVNGEDWKISEFKGSVLLIDFWATWCKPCVKMIPQLQKLHDKYKLTGFNVVGISIDEDLAKTIKFVVDKNMGYPVSIDDSANPAWEAFGVKGIPATYLIDGNGQIVAQWTGNDVKWSEMEKKVEALLASMAPLKPE
ncbi:MAG: redoxin domain-containing protein [Candidatus Eisenbacteria bacterium]|nr:redoxin domain-containing protein [Candidatus Eisenbacteria bacterium]